jgi:hypothetical protein
MFSVHRDPRFLAILFLGFAPEISLQGGIIDQFLRFFSGCDRDIPLVSHLVEKIMDKVARDSTKSAQSAVKVVTFWG